MVEFDYLRLHKLFEEFTEKIEEQHVLYLDSITGFKALHELLLHKQEEAKRFMDGHEYGEPEFQDTCAISYKELCGKDYVPMSLSPLMKQGDVKKRTMENGRNYWLTGAQCVVSIYSYWEDYLRKELASALRVSAKEVTHDIWGDLRHFRNAIVHNNGIATSEMDKCKVLQWYPSGEPIRLDYEKVRVIFYFLAAYRNHIHQKSLPPSKGILIPKK
jgi:hypothetical protein